MADKRWSISDTSGKDGMHQLEQLRMIKARTMYNMVEEIPSGSDVTPKLLFLTNSQADLLASNTASLQRMLNALEIPQPKLVINLLCSYGQFHTLAYLLYVWCTKSCVGPRSLIFLQVNTIDNKKVRKMHQN